ncbi:unnamed protein product [Acanthosepion pharaonis]|uniref:Uncharacterized protein n=1 Tax=Acanthosepion pharaonis TaxID=158019 RepID=A0A812C031_ACAPH|nr:unnamed protein product [Sepia pharaonis]
MRMKESFLFFSFLLTHCKSDNKPGVYFCLTHDRLSLSLSLSPIPSFFLSLSLSPIRSFFLSLSPIPSSFFLSLSPIPSFFPSLSPSLLFILSFSFFHVNASTKLSIDLFNPIIYLFIYLSIYLSIYLTVYLTVYLSTVRPRLCLSVFSSPLYSFSFFVTSSFSLSSSNSFPSTSTLPPPPLFPVSFLFFILTPIFYFSFSFQLHSTLYSTLPFLFSFFFRFLLFFLLLFFFLFFTSPFYSPSQIIPSRRATSSLSVFDSHTHVFDEIQSMRRRSKTHCHSHSEWIDDTQIICKETTRSDQE